MKPISCQRPCYKNNRTPFSKPKSILTDVKLIIFDMDGVLADNTSSWQYVHQHFNSSNEHSVKDYMNGSIDDLEFIRRDVSLWKTNGEFLKEQQLRDILNTIPLMNGANELFAHLRNIQIPTAILSAGLDILAHRIALELGISYVYANGLYIDNDHRLTGEGILRVKLMYKDEAVQDLSKELHIDQTEMIGIGNSCFDIPMLSKCGLGIAFNPADECIRDTADVVVEGNNLSDLIPIINASMKKTKTTNESP